MNMAGRTGNRKGTNAGRAGWIVQCGIELFEEGIDGGGAEG